MVSSISDLQLTLELFAAVGMKINTSESEVMVLSQKRVESLLWIGEVPPSRSS